MGNHFRIRPPEPQAPSQPATTKVDQERPMLQGSNNSSKQPKTPLARSATPAIAAAWRLALVLLAINGIFRFADGAQCQEATFCDPNAKHDIGYVKLPNKADTHYFFWYFESRSAHPETAPLVLWLSGGDSSVFSALAENGPCRVRPDLTAEPNPYSWNTEANVIWLDQPTGQGFSYGPSEDTVHNSSEAAVNVYWFLQEFLGTRHPELQGREFFIAGYSLAGHYIPSTAHYIRKMNQETIGNSNTTVINLQGITIGNGMVNPAIQYAHIPDMVDNAYNVTVLTDGQAQEMRDGAPQCATLAQTCQDSGTSCIEATTCWNQVLFLPFTTTKLNLYDVRELCTGEILCGDFSSVVNFLNLDAVYEYMGVRREVVPTWPALNGTVTQLFVDNGDWSRSFHPYVAELLDAGLRVLIYAGDADLMCNWQGNDAWTKALEWKGKGGFSAAVEQPFYPATPLASGGTLRTFENFAFLRVFNAGHMAPMDQPELTLDMISRFLKNEL